MKENHFISRWTQGLTKAQRKSIHSIRKEMGAGVKGQGTRSDGWTIYRTPSTGQAEYLELRHYLTGGTLARWVIEKDGTVSHSNSMGLGPLVKHGS